MACRSDGYLLQPSAPARAIDASFALKGNPEPHVENVHAIMATHTEIGDSKWAHVLVIGLNSSFKLAPEHLAIAGAGNILKIAGVGFQLLCRRPDHR